MKKLLIITLLLSGFVYGQSTKGNYHITFNSIAGYETNILKAPSFYQAKDGEMFFKNDLFANTCFTVGKLRFKTTSKTKKHTLDLKVQGQHSVFSSNSKVKSSMQQVSANYLYTNRKKWTNNIGITYKNVVKTGGVDNDNLIGAPLTYQSFRIANKLGFKLSKEWTVFIKPQAMLKDYFRKDYSAFLFFENGLNSGFEFKSKRNSKFRILIFGELKQRDYTISKMINEDDSWNELDGWNEWD
jgi:hypothetical protein